MTADRSGMTASLPVLGAVAVGGAVGALARYAVGLWWAGPWSMVTINLLGALAIGLLMRCVSHRRAEHRRAERRRADQRPADRRRVSRQMTPLLVPFVGAGVLGGFTSFSAAMADVHTWLVDGHWLGGIGLAVGTAVGAVAAVGVGWRWGGRWAGSGGRDGSGGSGGSGGSDGSDGWDGSDGSDGSDGPRR